MDISNFNKEELQQIENLLNISSTISNIYDNLYQLEIENKQNTDEYQKLLKTLEKSIKIENQKFEESCKTFEERKKTFKLLFSAKGLLKSTNNECIINQKYDDRVIRRTTSILSEKIILDKKFQKEVITPELIEFLKNLGLNVTKEEIYKEVNNSRYIQNAILNDMYSIILSNISEYILNKRYNKYKKELIKTKYYISFINPNLELQMIKYSFNPPSERYISSTITASLLGFNEKQYELIKEEETKFNTAIIIAELLNIKDEEYEKNKTNIESIIRQCFIRALLTLMCENSVYELNQNFHDLIESKVYLCKHQNDRISESIIIQCFKSQKYDRAKIRKLSLKIPRKN